MRITGIRWFRTQVVVAFALLLLPIAGTSRASKVTPAQRRHYELYLAVGNQKFFFVGEETDVEEILKEEETPFLFDVGVFLAMSYVQDPSICYALQLHNPTPTAKELFLTFDMPVGALPVHDLKAELEVDLIDSNGDQEASLNKVVGYPTLQRGLDIEGMGSEGRVVAVVDVGDAIGSPGSHRATTFRLGGGPALPEGGSFGLRLAGFLSAGDTAKIRGRLIQDDGSGPPICSFPSFPGLMLNRSRFTVIFECKDFEGKPCHGRAVDGGTDDSGVFWVFSPDNWEVLVKVLDGRAINDHFWVFAAATTNIEYTFTVIDNKTGAKARYSNPAGKASNAITDTRAFLDTSSARTGDVPIATATAFAADLETFSREPLVSWSEQLPVAAVVPPGEPAASNCADGPQNLCLAAERFKVEVDWRDFQGGTGKGTVGPLGSADSGMFWFFSENNLEMLVKLLDACSFSQHFWLFAAATTNVEYTITVTDTQTGAIKKYFSPLGNAAPAITDTAAFGSCPTS